VLWSLGRGDYSGFGGKTRVAAVSVAEPPRRLGTSFSRDVCLPRSAWCVLSPRVTWVFRSGSASTNIRSCLMGVCPCSVRDRRPDELRAAVRDLSAGLRVPSA